MDGAIALTDLAMVLGLSLTRLAVAFLVMPMFTQEAMPGLVRNSLFVSLAITAIAVQPPIGTLDVGAAGWMALFVKEAFIGLVIGLFASGVLWAVEMAGTLIDTKAGTQMGQVIDPINGQASSNTGMLLARLATFVFMASGGFMFMVGALLESYAVWPVTGALPAPRAATVGAFEAEFGRIMLLATMVAAPFIVILFVLEAALGLVNKYAPSLNLLAATPPIKALIATVLVAMLLGSTVDLLVREFASMQTGLLERAVRVLGR
ncbi:MAG: type III secretion system export apparatus subunit SctT [Burkholderiales bacterium]